MQYRKLIQINFDSWINLKMYKMKITFADNEYLIKTQIFQCIFTSSSVHSQEDKNKDWNNYI